ncbi:shikimate dehydrogenase [Chania multitudinisentens RB-25]|uniref:Shikimate dehydrogenase n=1 Tax=Chania multitudinisentens RB-25 TaxID=1441930 RepID=W0L3L1_9GAMM|nr:shikimate dehydrogenase [Chania multitudinisentens]AHG18343.1 shikimate dehydrogenase [Chania multitudinisentens RB-25]
MNTNITFATSRPPLYQLALLGKDIQGSLSPQLYEQEARRQGLRCSYQLLDFAQRGWSAETLPDVLRSLETIGFTGCNVTHPFKQRIIPYLDQLSPQAKAIGAVNTVLFRDGQRIGHNTDCAGFITHFQRNLAEANIERVLQIGAGGAGSACAYGLLEYGVNHLALYDRDTANSEALYHQLIQHFDPARISIAHHPQQALANSSGLVQATPIGMSGYPGMPIDIGWLAPHQWVADVIYVPRETELVLQARAKGCRAIGGDGMVVFQAAQAFELYTGLPPDREHMLEIFQQACIPSA